MLFDVLKKITSDNNLFAKNYFVSSVFLWTTKNAHGVNDSVSTTADNLNLQRSGSKYGFMLLLFLSLFLGSFTSVQAAQTPCSAIGGVLDGDVTPFPPANIKVDTTKMNRWEGAHRADLPNLDISGWIYCWGKYSI